MPSRRALGLLLLALLLSSCEERRSSAITLSLWAMGREGELVQQMLPAFQQEYPDIHVKVQQLPWSAAHEKLLTAYAGGNLPDVFQLGNTWIAEFVALDALHPLPEAGLPLDDYFPGILEANRLDNKLYGLPWYVDTRVLFYRRDFVWSTITGRLPTTWEGWLTTLRQVQTSGKAEFALLVPVNEWEVPTILAWQMGAELLRDGDRYGNFRSEVFRRAFDFYLSLYREKLTPHLGSTQVANMYQEFARGYFAGFITGPWNVGELRKRLLPSLQASWTTAPLPSLNGKGIGTSLAGGSSLVIGRNSTHREAALALLAFLSRPEQQIRLYHLTGSLPPRQSTWSLPDLANDRKLEAFRMQLRNVRVPPRIPEWERIAGKLVQHSERAIRGLVSVDTALDALDRDADAILEKRRWLLARQKAQRATNR